MNRLDNIIDCHRNETGNRPDTPISSLRNRLASWQSSAWLNLIAGIPTFRTAVIGLVGNHPLVRNIIRHNIPNIPCATPVMEEQSCQ